ncbi:MULTISPECIES: hypothetical protein [Gordonia]|jgi:hypothetical protein|uniref:Secreted protein n=1 Tax=Gordonia malaquae NBRC 108250 TaxID=1223542 RepID=M3VFY7_GORML|nr:MULTISPECIES: hypothetical protein [Gordonia]QRY61927.1 hypothetical protein JVX90_16195 [Gordonia sp. PDNC005]GAC80479.1 hypothetical protein GM1_018_00420 [Gordonia malaquae NBRC 108250]SEE15583.1 hypothetical protein SAMN04488550_3953 [Gordonia malaquae]
MKKTLTRAAVGIAAAGAIGASSLVAAPAQAAGPGDLQIIGGVTCTFKLWGPNWSDGPVWQMNRFMGVKNIGGSTMTGVTVTEFGGPTRWVKADKDKKTKTGELKPGQTAILWNDKWKGCWPASISGYTIGQQVENPFNNAGYWQNVKRSQPKP